MSTNEENINSTTFAKELQYGFSEYAKYVISDRALPDGRDGLKPVHRRILWAMHELKLGPRSPRKKCARIVGDTTGKYHPHAGGVYESLVRLAQDWSLRYPLVDPQGNFGSIDGYPAAAMRYTEARLARISSDLMENISTKIVPFIDNFDGEEKEPTVLPVKMPHLLINGSYGIAVGMSSNIPPHNLVELMHACNAIIDNPSISSDELTTYVTGPDFPTGGIIVGLNGIHSLNKTGKGSLRLRSKVHLETPKTHKKISKPMIVVDEIPYMQNKASIIVAIATLIDDKKLLYVKDVRDLSKDKIRIEIELDSDFEEKTSLETILAQLYRRTNLETLFHARVNAFVYGKPRTLNLKQSLAVFLDFRETTVKEIAKEELEKVLARLHILEGLIKASNVISDIISLIRASASRPKAHNELMAKYGFSDIQAKAILDMTLGRLTRMEQDALVKEEKERNLRKDELTKIIEHRPTLLALMKSEFEEIIKKYPEGRRTTIIESDDIHQIEGRPILHERDLLITSTKNGYLRSIEYNTFKIQGRGGRGVAGIPLDADDVLNDMVVASNLEDLLLITSKGQIFQVPAYTIKEVKNRNAKGNRIQQLIPGIIDDSVVNVVNVEFDKFLDDHYLITVTKNGIIKRTSLSKYRHIRKTGIRCLSFREDDDEVVDAYITKEPSMIFIATKNGFGVLFDENKLRPTGRTAQGVRGARLTVGDEVVTSFPISKDSVNDTSILTVTNQGKGKRTPLSKYRVTNRGTKGVINIKTGSGAVISSMPVPKESADAVISLINSSGTLIKINLKNIRNMGRSTQGVRVMRLLSDETLIMASHVVDEGEEQLDPTLIEEGLKVTDDDSADDIAEISSTEEVTEDEENSEEDEERDAGDILGDLADL
jgi:DNA gyrase subunit A